jgi:predicted CXXCH cytochrome family protein
MYKVWVLAALLLVGCDNNKVGTTPSQSANPATTASAAGGNSVEGNAGQPASPPVPSTTTTPRATVTNRYAGVEQCAGCHQQQAKDWQGSHHDLAMREPTAEMVKGDFNNTRFDYFGTVSTFYKTGDKYFVRTDGPDGKLQDFAISYTFGVYPLQQYLVAFPGGRLQALGIAWDTRPKAEGGQRWFHLYPDQKLTYKDDLHWTGRSQNWNFMCAECHSTHLQKNYDAAKREYHTTWTDINVACEACHGAGSQHISWAKQESGWEALAPTKGLTHLFNDQKGAHFLIDPHTGTPKRSTPRITETEIQVCAACHSRRAQLFEDDRHGQPLMDSFRPALLDAGTYHIDGQIQEENFEYGSFVQSKMYKEGVTCSNCHNPHTLKLKAEGNGVCLQCHGASQFDTPKHHHHPVGSTGAMCVNCHMPSKIYMGVDERHDHSFRIPRPAQSVVLGTPNACNQCHTDKTADWTAKQTKTWYGHDPVGHQKFAETLQAARSQTAGADRKLIAILDDLNQPAIARATAARAMTSWLSQETVMVLAEHLTDDDPLVRMGTLDAMQPLPPGLRQQLVTYLLHDPVRSLRIQAAQLLADVPLENLSEADRSAMEKASADYIAAQRHNADDPSAQVNLGNFYLQRGEFAKAEATYQSALQLDQKWIPAYVNLSDFYRQAERDSEAQKLLADGIKLLPDAAALYHSLGLVQVRLKDLPAAVVSLKHAVALAPTDARYNYVYAVALHSNGQTPQAIVAVNNALKLIPNNASLLELREQLRAE